MIEALIIPPERSLGDGITVRRALPAKERRSVGPFVFFDQMGPIELAGTRALDVRPHPHIGLATVTYLFEGEIDHRDSLGNCQRIRPYQVNWMVAGRGIVHSERTPQQLRGTGARTFGLQTWIALPRSDEESEPSFSHHENLPSSKGDGVEARVILGTFAGLQSPVELYSETVYADVQMQPAARIALPDTGSERALYVVSGTIDVAGQAVAAGVMAVLDNGTVDIKATTAARMVVLGGAPMEAPRHLWWNFVSSRRERIAQAADDWKSGRFAAVPGETEFIPLPPDAPAVVDYP